MRLESCSRWLDEITQPNHRYYHPFQIAAIACLTYVTTACFSRIPPHRAVTFTVSTYVIGQLLSGPIAEFIAQYQEVSLAPMAGQLLMLGFSFYGGKLVCDLTGQKLSFQEIQKIGGLFLLGLFITNLALIKLRKRESFPL